MDHFELHLYTLFWTNRALEVRLVSSKLLGHDLEFGEFFRVYWEMVLDLQNRKGGHYRAQSYVSQYLQSSNEFALVLTRPGLKAKNAIPSDFSSIAYFVASTLAADFEAE